MTKVHAAFLTLGIDPRKSVGPEKNSPGGVDQTRARNASSPRTLPSKPGYDRFTAGLMDYAMQKYRSQLPFIRRLMRSGRQPKDGNEPFCMTVLALKLSRARPSPSSELQTGQPAHCGNASSRKKRIRVPIATSPTASSPRWMTVPSEKFWREKIQRRGNLRKRTSTSRNSGGKFSIQFHLRRGIVGDALSPSPGVDRILRRRLYQGQAFRAPARSLSLLRPSLSDTDALTIWFRAPLRHLQRAP